MNCNIPEEHILYWKLPELKELVDRLNDDLEDTVITKKLKSGEDFPNIVLHTASRVIVTMCELICLVQHGYPDGALVLARNCYEHMIVLTFFAKEAGSICFERYVKQYYEHADIERRKAIEVERDFCIPTVQKAAWSKAHQDILNQPINPRAHGDYWWAGCKSFRELAKTVSDYIEDKNLQQSFHYLYLLYVRACKASHSSSYGNYLRLGVDSNQGIISTASTIQGHGIPLCLATDSLFFVIYVCSHTFDFDFNRYKNTLQELSKFYRQEAIKPNPQLGKA